MNKIGLLLDELHDAETELAAQYRAIAGRDAVEHDVYYICHTLAEQCDEHAAWIRDTAAAYDAEISAPRSRPGGDGVLDRLRHKASEMAGRRPESGLLLLRDLRTLYTRAETANIHWIMLGQVAQAVRNHDLLTQTTNQHKQCLTQIKWLKTKIKESTPQVLVSDQFAGRHRSLSQPENA